MKKILIFLALTIGLMWSVTFVLLPKIENKIDQLAPISASGTTASGTVNNSEELISAENQEKIDNKDIVREKIELIRKRLADKGLIIEGDSYYRDGQLALALKKYLDFYKKNPQDPLIIEKLGDTYFEMKKFSSAYNYYSKIDNFSDLIKEKTAQSLTLMTKMNDNISIEDTRTKLKNIGLSEEKLFYYDTSLSCSYDFHICKTNFGSYFWPEETQNSGTGSQDISLSYKSLIRIESAIVNYQNFKVDDVYLKDAYIIGAWYSNGFYNLSAYMGEQLLEEKVDYKPILKIVAQSYYELGEYEKSRDVLGKYYEIDDEDAAVAYLLGIVNSKLREYVLSNIYFNKALNVGYKDTSDIYRQLIHNFYVLENDKSILKSFVSLIEETEFTQNDLSLGIYYHIIHEEYIQAFTWAQKGIELFGIETGIFHTYQGWILTEKGEYEDAKILLQEGINVDGDNPFILINFAYNALARGKQGEALIYFKKVISVSENSEFAVTAQSEIEKLSQK